MHTDLIRNEFPSGRTRDRGLALPAAARSRLARATGTRPRRQPRHRPSPRLRPARAEAATLPSPGRSCSDRADDRAALPHRAAFSSSSAHRARSPRSETARASSGSSPSSSASVRSASSRRTNSSTDNSISSDHRQIDQREEPHRRVNSTRRRVAPDGSSSPCPPRRCWSRGQPATCSPGVNPDGFPRPRARDTGLRRRKATAPSSTARRRSPWPPHDPATPRQLAYIKELAYSRGVSFIPPANRAPGQPTDRPAQTARTIRALRDRRRPRRNHTPPRRARPQQHTPRRRDQRLRLARPLAPYTSAAPLSTSLCLLLSSNGGDRVRRGTLRRCRSSSHHQHCRHTAVRRDSLVRRGHLSRRAPPAHRRPRPRQSSLSILDHQAGGAVPAGQRAKRPSAHGTEPAPGRPHRSTARLPSRQARRVGRRPRRRGRRVTHLHNRRDRQGGCDGVRTVPL